MAHFRGSVQGTRGEASRLGSKISGLTARANGWNSGVTVVAHRDETRNTDVFEVYATGGSDPRYRAKLIATVRHSDADVRAGRSATIEFADDDQ